MTTTQEFKNYLISPGSVGSTYLENLFGTCIKSVKTDYNAHERNSNLAIFNNSKVCYIFGNPYDIVLSYFRRGFMVLPYQHAGNMAGDVGVLRKTFHGGALCWFDNKPVFGKHSWSLDEYLELNNDPFKLEEHFLNWYRNPDRKYEIMFLKYETSNNHIKELCTWFNIGEKYADKYQRKNRNSNYKNLNNTRLKKMQRLYGDFFDRVESLPDLIVDP
jgi:hypothetical protein